MDVRRWERRRTRVRNQQSYAQLTLPAAYVATSVELGYATTIHGAQGVTADTCHGLLTGTETRQQVYTMLTRGRYGNHAWVQVTDADSHPAPAARSLLAPATATRLLEGILARDDAPISATTLLLKADDPALLPGAAVTCYLDALGFATEHHVDQATKDALDAAGQEQGLTDADGWPTLRSHLMMLAANSRDPSVVLADTARARIEAARDRAAVLSHRLSLAFAADLDSGPLPWLPRHPDRVA